ncbi:hypothetical protein LTR04_001230, partial [Oleoguttula sp. CCFEE 6159]
HHPPHHQQIRTADVLPPRLVGLCISKCRLHPLYHRHRAVVGERWDLVGGHSHGRCAGCNLDRCFRGQCQGPSREGDHDAWEGRGQGREGRRRPLTPGL